MAACLKTHCDRLIDSLESSMVVVSSAGSATLASSGLCHRNAMAKRLRSLASLLWDTDSPGEVEAQSSGRPSILG